ncbi:MAG TPA: hypothetical protein VEB22_05595 [Phycisphaerales bacterium]|nr:hypothetical protein [Phycisphaerales bacterium]
MSAITESTRVSLRLRDYMIATGIVCAQAMALALYVDRRIGSAEARVTALETAKATTDSKLDRLIESVGEMRVNVARVEERTRK